MYAEMLSTCQWAWKIRHRWVPENLSGIPRLEFHGARRAIRMKAIFPALLLMIHWPLPASADEQRMFCGKTAEGWRDILRDKTDTASGHKQAVWALGCFGPEAKAAGPDLIEALHHGQFKNESVEALVQIGSGAEVTVPILIERFLKRRRSIAGPKARPAIPTLIGLVKKELPAPNNGRALSIGPGWEGACGEVAREAAGRRVSRQGASVPRYMPDVVGGRSPDPGNHGPNESRGGLSDAERSWNAGWMFAEADRRDWDPPMNIGECFENLGRFGVGGHLAIPRLNELRRHQNPWVRMWATETLKRIVPEDIR